jgi:serine/threonine protein kinase
VQLRCNACGHSWEEDVPANKGVVSCPSCYAFVVIKKAAPAAPAAPGAPAPRPVPPSEGDLYGERTILTGASPNELPTFVPAPKNQPSPAPRPEPPSLQPKAPAPAPKPAPAPAPRAPQPPMQQAGGPPVFSLDDPNEGETVMQPSQPPRPATPSQSTQHLGGPPVFSLDDPNEGETVMQPSRPPGRPVPKTEAGRTEATPRAGTQQRTSFGASRPGATPPPPMQMGLDPRSSESTQQLTGVAQGHHGSGYATHESGTVMMGKGTPPRGNRPTEDSEAGTVMMDSRVAGQAAAAPAPQATQARTTARGATPGQLELSPDAVPGYVIEKKLGAGGMGAVYKARQLSLDRDVALKVLPPSLASNPELLVRFTREALSAAQLTHHNIIQVYDVGSTQDNIHYISMEFVRGKSLGDLIRKEGKLQLDDAAAYVLQAARGLRYAHENGVIHRDIKPDNLMINEQGIIKIADMGLAKMRSTTETSTQTHSRDELLMAARGDLTMAEVAMGTPAYMPPEQARDASTVDHRADQYSLGCTLYYLCAGKAPYQGTTAFELITAHMTQPLTPIEHVVTNVPQALSRIVSRMLEKDPDSRYPSMEEVIRDLEAYLGVESSKGPYTPREQHLRVLENAVKAYYSAGSIRKRTLARPAFALLMVLGTVASVFATNFPAAGTLLGILLLTPLVNFVWDGVKNKTFLFRRVRAVFFGMPLRNWIYLVLGTVITLAVLYFLKLLLLLPVMLAAAVGLAAAYQFLVIRPLTRERAPAIAEAQEMLKQLRVRGVGEDALMDFVCRFSGEDWEEFFEELFGYQNMVLMRGKWASMEQVAPRRKHATWRDPVVRWLEEVEEGRKRIKEIRTLKKVEASRLQAQGKSAAEAEKAAELEATRVIAEELRPKAEKAAKQRSFQGAKVIKIRGPMYYVGGGWRVLRLLMGACIALAGVRFLGRFSAGPADTVLDWFGGFISGTQGAFMAILAGTALLLTAFSRRQLLHIVSVLGAAAMVWYAPITRLVANPQFTETICFYGGFGALLGAFAICVLAKFTGGKF